ncbi:hypothetical protein [Intrasporangium sp.]|uniref:hypothetical protein n=1 Tax=Intrasporangium sp. TaxID=1925024 RepID=UPI0032215D2A
MPAPRDTPAPFDHKRLLLGASSPSRMRVALVSGLSLGVAATIATFVGNPSHALLVSLGAFAAMYGIDRPYRHRAWLLTVVTSLFLGGVVFGAVTERLAAGLGAEPGTVAAGGLVVIAGITLLAALATFLASALQVGPPGGFFFALVASMASLLSSRGISVGELAGLTLLGALTGMTLSLLPGLRTPHRPVAKRLHAADAALTRHLTALDAGRATSRTAPMPPSPCRPPGSPSTRRGCATATRARPCTRCTRASRPPCQESPPRYWIAPTATVARPRTSRSGRRGAATCCDAPCTPARSRRSSPRACWSRARWRGQRHTCSARGAPTGRS